MYLYRCLKVAEQHKKHETYLGVERNDYLGEPEETTLGEPNSGSLGRPHNDGLGGDMESPRHHHAEERVEREEHIHRAERRDDYEEPRYEHRYEESRHDHVHHDSNVGYGGRGASENLKLIARLVIIVLIIVIITSTGPLYNPTIAGATHYVINAVSHIIGK